MLTLDVYHYKYQPCCNFVFRVRRTLKKGHNSCQLSSLGSRSDRFPVDLLSNVTTLEMLSLISSLI